MGTWGYGPYDSDAALDWMGKNIITSLEICTRKLLADQITTGGYEEEIRAAAQLFIKIQYPPFVNTGTIQQLIEALDKIQNDQNWINSWKDPEAISLSIKHQIKKLQKKLPAEVKVT